MMSHDRTLLSNTITFLRFPLMVGIILIHIRFPLQEENMGQLLDVEKHAPFAYFYTFFSSLVPSVCVPLFFIISGFLFFYSIQKFDLETYKRKLNSRIKSLLIPYLFWNFFIILIFFIGQLIWPSLSSGNNVNFSELSLREWLMLFWDKNGEGLPFAVQMWFVRDLLVMILLSPLFFALLKPAKGIVIITFLLPWILFPQERWLVCFSTKAITFFAIGAFLALHQKDFITLSKRIFPVSGIIWLMYSLFLCVSADCNLSDWIYEIDIILGIVAVLGLAAQYADYAEKKQVKFLSSSNFFLFCSHMIPLALIMRMICRLINPQNDFMAIVCYFAILLSTVAMCLFAYHILKKSRLPFLWIMTGGR